MYPIIRNILFLLDAEKAHHWGLWGMSFLYKILPKKIFCRLFNVPNYPLPIIDQKNLFQHLKIGLAAGLDKNAQHYKALAALGFQFVEIGTVTPRPQAGNPKPRLFRLIKDEAIINRMGFNNDGVFKIKQRLINKPSNIVVGANIGKNKDTANEKAVEDYLICFRELYEVVDYFVVNVSSPNTPDLRSLQEKEPLIKILSALKDEEKKFSPNSTKPILLKIAPDLNDHQLQDIVEVVKLTDIAGIIATNTTITRDGLKYEKHPEKYGPGGLSGKPLFDKSFEIIYKLKQLLPKDKILIGVGGIDSEDRAEKVFNAGANAIQLYTAFIYKGPAIIHKIRKHCQI
jgi:dihydroorotate dehydrogenase